MQIEVDQARIAAVDDCVASQEWQADFARVYAARERCSSSQAARVASIVFESLSLMAPLEAVATVFSDGDLLMVLRIATREAPGNSHIPDPLSRFIVVATAA